MLPRSGLGLVSVLAATLLGSAPTNHMREPEYQPWSCTGWDSYNIADCHRWGGANFLTFDWYSYQDCYYNTDEVVVFVSPSRTNLSVYDYGAIPGDESVNHLATCLVYGINVE